MNTLTIIQGDALTELRKMPECSVNCCVTSPPYFALRDYGHPHQIGLESTTDEYVRRLCEVFEEVRRVLCDDGTCWIVLGDSYSGRTVIRNGEKSKDLIGVPWSVAFALQADGWYLRSEITWCKRAPMPESVTDRPTCATEKIFLLTKSGQYFYDAAAVRIPPSEAFLKEISEGYNGQALKGFEGVGVQNASDVKSRIIANARKRIEKQRGHSRRHAGFNDRWDRLTKKEQMLCGSNMRNYWLLGPEPLFDNHFAAFPSEIPRRCILAGCPVGGVVLDPFLGSGTTTMVALELGRRAIGIELNPEYVQMADRRCDVTPGLPLK